jgi:uncharacterized cupredoxin-like copper-binding protein
MNLRTLAATGLFLLAVSACGGAATKAPTSTDVAPTSGSSGPAAAASPTLATTPITERDFKFDTPDIAVTGVVALAVTNAGPTVHDLSIRDAAAKVVGETHDLKPGASETLTVDLPTGTYTIFCALPGHESLGLKGTLTVTR